MTAIGDEGSIKAGSSPEPKLFSSSAEPHPMRRSTRVRWKVPVVLTSLDPSIAVVERCVTVVVNLHGCALRASCKFPTGTPVQLEVNGDVITGRVVGAVPIGARANLWMVGVSLDHAGNIWRIEDPPGDWKTAPELAQAPAAASKEPKLGSSVAEKFAFWPSAFGPATPTTDAPTQRPLPAASADSKGSPATETVPGNGSEHIQAPFVDANHAAAVRLQAEIKRRAESEWSRLRSLAEQHFGETEAQLQSELETGLTAWREERAAAESKLQEVLQTREQVEGLLNKAADVLRAEVAPARDQVTGEVRAEVNALIRSFQEKIAAETAAQRAEMESRAAAEATRLREEAERQAQSAETQLRSELERERIAWQEQRAAVEGKLQEVLQTREQVEGLLNSAADGLRAEMLPLRDQVTDEARDQLQALIRSFEEKVAAHWAARELTASSATTKIEEMRDDCARLISQLERRVQEDQAAGNAIRAQLDEILQARAGQELLLRQHRADQEAAQHAMRDQADRACQAQEAIQSTARSVSSTIATQVQECVQAMLGQLREVLARDLSTQVGAAVEGVEAHARGLVGEASQELRQELSKELARQKEQVHEAAGMSIAELQALETNLHKFAAEWSETIAAESERLAAQAQEELHKSTAEQLTQVERASSDGLSALHTVAGNLLTSMHHELLNDFAREQRQVLQLTEARIHVLLDEGQQTTNLALQQTARDAADSLRQEVSRIFEERQQRFETAHAAATAQLLQLEKRTDELTAIVDVELQSHTDEFVRETVAGITEKLQQVSESVREAHVNRLQEEADRRLGMLMRQADEAGAQLRGALDSVQSEKNAGETTRAQLQRAVQEGQAWVQREKQEFERAVHDTFLGAAGEIRGRIEQAVAMASEPMERRSREIQDEIAAIAQNQVERLQEQMEAARHRLRLTCQESESAAESVFERRATETLDDFRQNLQELEQSSMDRWQSALVETLGTIPRILATKLPARNSTDSEASADGCAAPDRAGAEDGGA